MFVKKEDRERDRKREKERERESDREREGTRERERIGKRVLTKDNPSYYQRLTSRRIYGFCTLFVTK